jgi:hypothetical protein
MAMSTPSNRRRYLTFSLRTLFVLLTAFAVWLGVVVNRVREQREAVAAIHALGGTVSYDWQPRLGKTQSGVAGLYVRPPARKRRAGPAWLRRLIGDDFFQEVVAVGLHSSTAPEAEILQLTPHLRRLRRLDAITVSALASEETQDKLRTSLPDCEVFVLE